MKNAHRFAVLDLRRALRRPEGCLWLQVASRIAGISEEVVLDQVVWQSQKPASFRPTGSRYQKRVDALAG